jgi:putative ABC transport system permease protein
LSKKFVILMIIANLAALPATYYIVNLWLQNFAYHIDFSAGPFLVALLICAFFTGLSLIYHTVAATNANPVEALSYE